MALTEINVHFPAQRMRTKTWISSRGLRGTKIARSWAALYLFLIGALAGFLGSVASLFANIFGAWLLGLDSMMLLRVYATMHLGEAALTAPLSEFFVETFLAHLAVGSFFGGVFMMLAAGRRLRNTQHMGAAVLFGLALWVLNFYLLLSWMQPLIAGEAFVVRLIPWWVAALTHACYGFVIGAVTLAFRRDIED